MTDLDLRAGRLEQSCPICGRWEAAGSYCSGCGRPMGSADWYPNGALDRRELAREKAAEIASTRVKRPRGRPSGKQLAAMPDADFAAFIEDSGIGTVSRPRLPGEALTGSSVPPVRAGAEVSVSPGRREPADRTSASGTQ